MEGEHAETLPMRRVYQFDLFDGNTLHAVPADDVEMRGYSWQVAADWFVIRPVRRDGDTWAVSSPDAYWLNPASVVGVWRKGEMAVADYDPKRSEKPF